MTPPLILVVEDSLTQSLQLQHVLEQEGYRAECVPTAEQALEAFNRELPDLVIVDYHLPGLQGADLCREIRLNVGTFSLPVLMLTGDDTPEAQRNALESGADDFLPKSARRGLFLLRVRNLLRQSRRTAESTALARPLFHRSEVLVVGVDGAPGERLVEALLGEGCRILRAADGREAERLVDGSAVDCVILAADLPDTSPVELCRTLADPSRSTDPPSLILLTDDEDGPLVAGALDSGADDFVSPDADVPLLRARMRAVLRRRFLLRQSRMIQEDVRSREMEALRLRAEAAAAEARARLAEELENTNRELAQANAQLAHQARVTKTITDNVTTGLFMIDRAGRPTFMNPAAEQMTGYRLQEIGRRRLFDLFEADGPDGLPEVPLRERPGTFRRRDGSLFPVAWSVAPLIRDSETEGAVLELVDITDRKRAEQHQLMLMAELSHRVKNTLATVLSIASQTMRRHREPQEFRAVFDGRIRALAATHNLLAHSNWIAVALRDVVANELAPYRDDGRDNLRLDGPDIMIRPKAALVLGMAFHELATNAAKYGAFSSPGGRVAVHWQPFTAGGEDRVRIEWAETGGPRVEPPTRKGLGRTLIEGGLAYELRGRALLEFEPNGLRCRMEIPLGELEPETAPEPGPEAAGRPRQDAR